jgi:hypothetical protein
MLQKNVKKWQKEELGNQEITGEIFYKKSHDLFILSNYSTKTMA